jgi:protein-tyrosine phosphatase
MYCRRVQTFLAFVLALAVVAVGPLAPSSALADPPGAITSATVTRIGNDFLLSWTITGEVDRVKIKEGSSPELIDHHVAEVSGVTYTTVTGLNPAERHYFELKGGSGGDKIITAERGVPQVGVNNFRDIGGYASVFTQGSHTKTVRWGQFFRSGSPTAQSNQGFLTTLGVKTVIDVRAPNEITATAPLWSAAGVNVISSPIFDQTIGGTPDPVTPHLCLPQNVSPSNPSHHYFPFDPVCFADQDVYFGLNGEFFTQFKTAAYRGFVSGVGPPGANFGQTVNVALRTLLLTLTDSNNLPLVWADTGGAARVGFGSAMVGLALGMREDDVIRDYLLTNEFRGPISNAQLNGLVNSGLLGKRVYLEPQLFEREDFMQGILEEIHQRYGSFENYANQALGITDEQLGQIRANLLEK